MRVRRSRVLLALATGVFFATFHVVDAAADSPLPCPRGDAGSSNSQMIQFCDLTLTGSQANGTLKAVGTFTIKMSWLGGPVQISLASYHKPPPPTAVTYPQQLFSSQTGTFNPGQSGRFEIQLPQCGPFQVDLVVGGVLQEIPDAGDGYVAQGRRLDAATGGTNGCKNLAFSGSMEGALKWSAGAWINGGYHFNIKGSNTAPVNVVFDGNIKVPVHCGGPGGPLAAGSPILVPVTFFFTGANAYPANFTGWWLTGDQNSIKVWMNAVQSPNLCSGGLMYNSEGATFDMLIGSAPHNGPLNVQWHYRIPAAKGKPNTNCTDASDPNRNRADVCGASWSATKDP